MEIDALLCDAVSVREGLLHVLGGGVSRIAREGFPAPLGLDLALRIAMSPDEAVGDHEIRIEVMDANDHPLGSLRLTFAFHEAPPERQHSAAFAVPLRTLPIPRPGPHHVAILLRGQARRRIDFVIEQAQRREG